MTLALVRRAHRARRAVANLAPPRRTALRLPGDRRTPSRAAFASFGAGTYVVPPVRISGASGIDLGDAVLVHENGALRVAAERGARLSIGDRTRLGPGVQIVCTQRIDIGPAVASSDYVTIVDTWADLAHPPGVPPPPGGPVIIAAGAYLGWGCVVGPNVRIGEGAYVGEGAVVLDDVPDHAVVQGNPAVAVQQLDPASGRWEGQQFP